MARRQSISWAELRVGLLVLGGFALLAVGIFFIGGEGGFFRARYAVTAYFASAGGMKTGAEVRVEGVTAGNVRSVRVTNDPDPERFVAVEMAIDESYTIPSDSLLTIGSIGLLGDAIVEIERAGAAGAPLGDGDEIQGQSGGDIRAIVQGANDIVANFDLLSDQILLIMSRIEQGEGSLGQLLTNDSVFRNVDTILDETRLLVENARTGDGTVGRLMSDRELYDRMTAVVADLEGVVGRIENGEGTIGLLARERELYDRMLGVVGSAEELIADVRGGQGTLGRLLTDETLYTNLNAAVVNVDETVTRIAESEGTFGRLIDDPAMYDNMNQTIAEFLKLMYDFRENPERFLTINFRLF